MRKSVNYLSSVIRRLSSDHFHSGGLSLSLSQSCPVCTIITSGYNSRKGQGRGKWKTVGGSDMPLVGGRAPNLRLNHHRWWAKFGAALAIPSP